MLTHCIEDWAIRWGKRVVHVYPFRFQVHPNRFSAPGEYDFFPERIVPTGIGKSRKITLRGTEGIVTNLDLCDGSRGRNEFSRDLLRVLQPLARRIIDYGLETGLADLLGPLQSAATS